MNARLILLSTLALASGGCGSVATDADRPSLVEDYEALRPAIACLEQTDFEDADGMTALNTAILDCAKNGGMDMTDLDHAPDTPDYFKTQAMGLISYMMLASKAQQGGTPYDVAAFDAALDEVRCVEDAIYAQDGWDAADWDEEAMADRIRTARAGCDNEAMFDTPPEFAAMESMLKDPRSLIASRLVDLDLQYIFVANDWLPDDLRPCTVEDGVQRGNCTAPDAEMPMPQMRPAPEPGTDPGEAR